jgi:hypothetical protein
MARAEVELGKLVEAAEHYQLLIRTPLEEDAPDAFKNAVKEGEQELEQLSPRIPSVVISVEPNKDAEVSVDGRPIPNAALGARMPVNPGTHQLTVEQPGYEPLSTQFSIAEKESKDLPLTLKVDPNYKPPSRKKKKPEVSDAEEERLVLGFVLGLRLEAAVVGGDVGNRVYLREGNGAMPSDAQPDSILLKDFFNPGGGLELRGGARLFQQVSAIIFYQGGNLGSGRLLEEERTALTVVESGASYSGFGFGVLGEAQAKGLLGLRFHGELDWVLRRQLQVNRGFEEDSCKYDVTVTGAGLRLGFGVSYPVTKQIHVGPHLAVGLGEFSEVKYDPSSNCSTAQQASLKDGKQPITGGDRKGHTLVNAGLGVEYLFGD